MKYLLFGLMVFSALNINAETAKPAKFSAQEMVVKALAANPEIVAAHKKWDSQVSRISTEKGYDRTKIFYETMYSNRERVVGVSQEIPFPGKLSLKGSVARKEVMMAESTLHSKENEIAARTKSAVAELFLAYKSIEIYNQNTDLMRHFAKVAESKYTVGKVSQVDVLKAQVELSRMLNMLVTLDQEKETSQAMLNILLNQDPETELGIPEEPQVIPLNLDYKTLAAAALENRPELMESRHHLHHTKTALASARMEYLPDWMVEFRRRSADNPDMDGSNEFMVGASIPLWFWKTKGMTDAAKAEQAMGEAEFSTMKNMTLWMIKDLWVKLRAAERLVTLYRTSVIPQAENALRITQTAYQSDRASFLDLVDVQRNLLQFQMEHYQHVADYQRILAQLEQAVGKPLAEVKR